MGKSRRASDEQGQREGTDEFELYDEDVWEDDQVGHFARERWSEGPRRRRSQWLRQQLDLASEGGESELSPFSRIG
jgi:hypothetical protein